MCLVSFLTVAFTRIPAHCALGRSWSVEEWLAIVDMEFCRRADLLPNTILGILLFAFPRIHTWMLFFGVAGSNCWL